MEWYYIVLIAVGSVIILAGLVFLIIWLTSKSKKKKINEKAKEYYNNVIEAVGGIHNIIDVQVNGSRLSFMLKDSNLLKENMLEGVGIVKSSKKVTLVIGVMANDYYNSITKELNKN